MFTAGKAEGAERMAGEKLNRISESLK